MISINLFGQDKDEIISGKVSFVTSKNVYVKIENTENFNIGDTLKFINQIKPCLLVKNKSSNSLVCTTIDDAIVKKGDLVYFRYTMNNNKVDTSKEDLSATPKQDSIAVKNKKPEDIEKIRGKVSVATNSFLSEIRDDRHSVWSTIALDAYHINNSKFSFESYLNYRKNFVSQDKDYSGETSFFNVYDLSLRYEVDPTLSVSLGRKINPKIASIGAVDGLQVEKYLGKNYVGLIAGYRPDFYDYSFNSDLFEYGAYIGRLTDSENFNSETTLGFIEQRNSGEIDRRYAYFQHSSTVLSKLNIFSSLEVDLYNKVNDTTNSDFRLTNLYVSARYRFNRKFDIMLSFDSRKRIVYYETFQTEIEKILDDDISRQGLRMRMNFRPLKNVHTGFSYSKRFQSDNQNKSDNIYGYVSVSRIPVVGGSVSVDYNMNTSNYLKSNIFSIRHSRSIIENKLNADFYYRFANYDYFNSFTSTNNQSYYGANFSLYISRTLMFSVFGEFSTSSLEDNYRINTKLVKRFSNKKKK